MILSLIVLAVLIIAVTGFFMTKNMLDGMAKEVKNSLNTIPESIDSDLDILRALRIIK